MIYRECQASLRRFTVLIFAAFLITSCGYSTASFLAKGEDYLQKRKFHDAMMQFRSAAESDPGSAKAHWGLARSYENLGQFNEALEELRKTVELDDANLDAKAKLGNYFLLLTPPMIAEAEKLRDEILQADPKFIEGQMLTASIMASQGRPDVDVVAAVNRAIAVDPQRIESYISLQRFYMTREKAADAEKAIQAGLAAAPSSVLGHTEYGRFLMYADRDADAEAQFEKAIATDTSSIEAHQAMAEFYVTSRQMEKAERAYQRLVEIQENSPESRLELAAFLERAGRIPESIATLDEILNDSPEYALARYRLGQLHLERKDYAGVNQQLAFLFKINDDDIEALLLRARLRIQENSPDQAIKDLEEILKKQPSGREPLFLMAQARLAAGQLDQANAFILDLERYHPAELKAGLLRIQAAFTAGDAGTAFKLSDDLLGKVNSTLPTSTTDPRAVQELRVRALSSRGLASLELMRLPQARADLHEVMYLSPRSASAAVNLAKVDLVEKKFDAALALYEKALAADPQNFDAVSGIVDSCVRLGRSDLAHARTDELMASPVYGPTFVAGLHYLRSTVFRAEGKSPEAERELLASIGADENYLPAYSGYAALLMEQNRADEAVEQYQKVIALRPTAQVYTLLGILQDSMGRSNEAETAYRRALELTSDSPIAANNLAWLLVERQGNLDEALQLASAAVSRNPTTPGFYDTLGWVYLQKGLTLPAVEQLKRAVALDESSAKRSGTVPDPAYRVRLGMALSKAGDAAAARREAETSLRLKDKLSQREIVIAKGVLAGSH